MSSDEQSIPQASPDLSVVVLCYKAGEYVYEFVGQMQQQLQEAIGENFELVLVGNYHEGSGDDTPKHVRQLAEQNKAMVAVCEVKQGMMGWDMKSGLYAATGKYVAVIDGDGQMPIADVLRVYEVILADDTDLAKTYRVSRGDGLKRKIFSYGFNLITRMLFPGICSRDINSKPKLLKRECLAKMQLDADDWFIDAEIMLEARRMKLKVSEVATEFNEIQGRRSFVNSASVLEFLKNLLVYRIREFKR